MGLNKVKLKRDNKELIRVVVARRTKGEAFSLDHDVYRKRQQLVTIEVQTQLNSLGRIGFINLNREWLWDEKK